MASLGKPFSNMTVIWPVEKIRFLSGIGPTVRGENKVGKT